METHSSTCTHVQLYTCHYIIREGILVSLKFFLIIQVILITWLGVMYLIIVMVGLSSLSCSHCLSTFIVYVL